MCGKENTPKPAMAAPKWDKSGDFALLEESQALGPCWVLKETAELTSSLA